MRNAARVLIVSLLFASMTASAALMFSSEASAAGIDGTWTSRVDGKGYTQTYLYFGGSTITEYYDCDLELSSSGSDVSGTLTVYQNSGPTSVSVDGTFDGTTFIMTAHYSWYFADTGDGVYTLTMDGNQLYGSGSYLNVGVTINGYIDLVKGAGSLGLGAIAAPMAMAGMAGGVIGAVALFIPSPKPGFKPGTGSVGYSPAQPVPSVVSETNPGMIGPPEPGQPLGGAGMSSGYQDPTVWRGPGAPPAPREWYSSVSQQPPQCPIHQGTFTTPHYSGPSDQGSWYCPHCKGYPWGRKV